MEKTDQVNAIYKFPNFPSMYVPDYHMEKDPKRISDFLKAHPFGVLVSNGPKSPVATHLPFLIDAGKDGQALEIASHMARANPQWKMAQNQECLLIFSGPHAYISTGLYANRQTVPTWNYIAVHVTGRPKWIDDKDELLELMNQTIRKFGDEGDWNDWQCLEASVLNRLLKGVVGFQFEIEGIKARFKLSQNKSARDRDNVGQWLLNGENPMHRELGHWMNGFPET